MMRNHNNMYRRAFCHFILNKTETFVVFSVEVIPCQRCTIKQNPVKITNATFGNVGFF